MALKSVPASCEPQKESQDLFRPDTFFVAHRYSNHAGPSGYDRFADYLGESIEVSDRLRAMGETLLRLPAKVIAANCGSYEYSRHDAIQELAARVHMGTHRDALYHFLYAEKSLRFLGRFNRWRGNRIIGSFHHCAFKYPLYFQSTKHFASIEHAVVVSSIQLEHMEKIIGSGRVSVVPYAVDADYFRPSQVSGLDRRPRCTCVGQHLRDYDRLEKMIPIIRNAVPGVEFYIIGANRQFDRLQFLDGVVFKRGIADAEYLDILQNSDLLVLPLTDSTSVTTVNEALACGVPVITNRGGVSDYLNDDCSIQVLTNDPDEMVAPVIDLLRDGSTRQRMGVAARKQGMDLNWPNSARKMRDLYDRVCR